MWQGSGGPGGAELSVAHALKKFGSHPTPPESALEQVHMQFHKSRLGSCKTDSGCERQVTM
eukprot:3096936-Amphidinium_carterae.1